MAAHDDRTTGIRHRWSCLLLLRRLAAGATVEQAEAQFRVVTDRLAAEYPWLYGEGFTVRAANLIDNTVGAQEQHNLLGANEGFCFLTEVSLRDIDDGNEMGTCRVYIDGNNTWTLMAQISGSTGDADAYCEAMCIKFQ